MKILNKLGKIAAVCALAGVVLFLIGMTVLGWDFIKLDTAEYTAKSYNSERAQSIERVDITVQSFPIEIKSGNEFKLDYYEASDSTVKIEEKDGVVTIAETYKYNPFVSGIFNLGRSSHKFVMTVPQGIVLNIHGTNCDITAEDMEFRALVISVTNCNADLTRINIANEFILGATNINGKLDGVSAATMEITATNINLEMANCKSAEMTMKGTNIDAEFSRSVFVEFSVDATNLTVDSSADALTTCVLKATNADISLERLSVDYLTVTATNLTAGIEIVGMESDYSVISTGKGLPASRMGNTDKSITLKGTNNTVRLFYCS